MNKRLIPFLVIITISLFSCEKENDIDFQYTQYTNYTTKSNYTSYSYNNTLEFLIIKDTSALNNVLYKELPYYPAEDSAKITADDFKTKNAIAILMRYRSTCECDPMILDTVILNNQKLTVKYRTSEKPAPTTPSPIVCDMVCYKNLLFTVNTLSFTSIDFYQNDTFLTNIKNQ